MKIASYGLIILLLIIVVTGIVFAEENIDSSTEESPDKKETIHIRPGQAHYYEEEDKLELTEGVVIYKDDSDEKASASEGVFYQKEKKAVLKDNVILEHSEGQVTSDEMTAWMDEDKYIFEQNVKLYQQLDDEGDFNLETVHLVLFTNDDSFEASGGVQINHENRIMKSDQAVYNDQEETLLLTGNVQIEEDDGDWIKSKQAIFYLKTDEFNIKGDVEMELII